MKRRRCPNQLLLKTTLLPSFRDPNRRYCQARFERVTQPEQSPSWVDFVEELRGEAELIDQALAIGARRARRLSYLCRGWIWRRDQLCKLSEVLSGRREQELIARAGGSTETQAVELENALEVGEQHLDLLAQASRHATFKGPCDRTRHVAPRSAFVRPQLPVLRKEPPQSPGWCHELKFDGYRLQIHKIGREVRLFSKSGNDFTSRYPSIAGAVTKLPTRAVILDAELTSCDADGRPNFNALIGRKHKHLCVWVFDILAQNGNDLRQLALEDRRSKLNQIMRKVESVVVPQSELFDDQLRTAATVRERTPAFTLRVNVNMRRTSLTHPLQIAVATAGPEFGRVGITFCPGKCDQHAMSGRWERDLTVDLDMVHLRWLARRIMSDRILLCRMQISAELSYRTRNNDKPSLTAHFRHDRGNGRAWPCLRAFESQSTRSFATDPCAGSRARRRSL
jgi:ATP dependent DNA ligase-like protein